ESGYGERSGGAPGPRGGCSRAGALARAGIVSDRRDRYATPPGLPDSRRTSTWNASSPSSRQRSRLLQRPERIGQVGDGRRGPDPPGPGPPRPARIPPPPPRGGASPAPLV